MPEVRQGSIGGYRLFVTLGLAVYLLDQATKLWILYGSGLELGAYPPFGGYEVIPGVFAIVYAVNEGAAWGMFKGHSEWLALVQVVALAAIAVFRKQLELYRIPVQWAFGLITGGILGNLTDRIRLGHVVDFLDVDLQFYRWPTFNVADSCIVIGVGLYLIYSLRQSKEGSQGRPKST